MKKVFFKVLLTLFIFLAGYQAFAVEFNLLVLPADMFSVCDNYFCFPSVSEVVSNDVISNLNSYKNIHAVPLSSVRSELESNYQLKSQTKNMLDSFNKSENIDFSVLKELSNKFGVKSIALISSYAVTDISPLKRDLWDVMELSSAFQFTYPFTLKTNVVLTDTVNDIVMWSGKYERNVSDSQSKFSAKSQIEAVSQLEKIKDYSFSNISLQISQSIHHRFFPQEVRVYTPVKVQESKDPSFVPNALNKLSEPRSLRELNSRPLEYDVDPIRDLFDF